MGSHEQKKEAQKGNAALLSTTSAHKRGRPGPRKVEKPKCGRAATEYAAINQRVQKHRTEFLAHFMPDEEVRFKPGRSMEWVRRRKHHGDGIRKNGRGYHNLLAACRKNNRFAEAARDIDAWLNSIERPNPTPAAEIPLSESVQAEEEHATNSAPAAIGTHEDVARVEKLDVAHHLCNLCNAIDSGDLDFAAFREETKILAEPIRAGLLPRKVASDALLKAAEKAQIATPKKIRDAINVDLSWIEPITNPDEIAAIIDDLAQCDAIVYGRKKKAEADALGIAVVDLDKRVTARKREIAAEKKANAKKQNTAGSYEAKDSGLYWMKVAGDGAPIPQRLTNFCAWIVGERIEDDGAERRSLLDIEAEIHGRKASFTVAASHFSNMNWALENIGADAVVEPGFGSRDRARAAIQYLSGRTPRHHTYAHSGWRQIEGQGWAYLHASGALCAHGALPGIDVAMPGALTHYALPTPSTPEELVAAVRSSLALLELAPDRISVPLLGAAYRAALGNTDFSLHLSGFTGTGKSEVAALMQQHYGPEMHAKRLPGSWSSTANQLEGLAFSAKDALFVIDDFVPQGSAIDRARLNQAADRVLRGVGNSSGRGRAGPDGKPRPAKPPRALVISTGEEIPGGQSLRARLLVIEITKGAIGHGDLRNLLPYQEAAISSKFAMAMAGFIQWLAKDFDASRREFDEKWKTRRHHLVATANHARTGDIGAQLATAWQFLTRFAVESGAIREDEALAYLERADKALALVVSEQAEIQVTVDPIERFRALLNGVVASGRAHIASKEGEAPSVPEAFGWRKIGMEYLPQGRLIGWEDGAGGLYLEPESSFTAVQEMGNATGEGVGIGNATLRKRLHERGMLLSTENDKNKARLTVRHTIGGKRRNVVHITNLLSIPENSAPRAPDAPIEEKNPINQTITGESNAKDGAPIKDAGAPGAPEVVRQHYETVNGSADGALNGMAHKVAHEKCAIEKQCAADGRQQPIVIVEQIAEQAHVAHKFEAIGKDLTDEFEASADLKGRFRI